MPMAPSWPVSDSADNDAVLYPGLSGTSLGTASVVTGSTPDGVAMDGVNAFVANEGSSNVTVVDPPARPAHGHHVHAARRAAHLFSLRPLVAPRR